MPLDLFFPGRGDETGVAGLVCSSCPVRQECGTEALSRQQSDDHGIWGGMSQNYRKRVRRRLRASA
jgi:WhiB family redox-sensing transcriptional regulator